MIYSKQVNQLTRTKLYNLLSICQEMSKLNSSDYLTKNLNFSKGDKRMSKKNIT